MKRASQALPLAVLLATASAQTNTVVGTNSALEGTTTITYSVCPTAATLTTTLSQTLTLCPGPYCNGGSPTVTLGPGQGQYVGGYTTIGPNGESTVYQTYYPATCSTGLADVTYMITEACPCSETRPADHIPSGFSTTVATVLTKSCDTCAEYETILTLTTPCATGPYATAGVTNTGAAPAATGGAAGGGAPAAGGAAATGASYPAGGAGSNSTVSPPITPVGGNVASDVGQNPATFTGAAQKMDIVGFSASAALALFVGATAWLL